MAQNEGMDAGAATERSGFFSRFTRATQLTRSSMREVGRIMNVLRAPLIVSLMGVLVFGFPGQIYEIYRLYAEDFTLTGGFVYDNLRFAIFMAMLYASSYVLWYIARVLTIIDPPTKAALVGEAGNGWVARWAPRIIGAAPAFAAAFGMARAEFLRDGGEHTPELYGAAAIAALIGLMRLWSSWRRTRGDAAAYDKVAQSALSGWVRLVFGIVLLAGICYLMTQPIALTQTVGSLGIIGFFMVALVFGWAQLTYLYDRFAIPALTILVAMLMLWSFLDWNDNHFIRELPQDEEQAALQQAQAAVQVYGPRLPLTAKTAFEDWLDNRADRQAYLDAKKPYPVYVIAAQGGGLYAAYQSALYMAKLQDACPTFAQHVFAISGVSGGAVGATAFTALAMEHAQNQPIESLDAPCGVAKTDSAGEPVDFTQLTNDMLRQDFLSPVVSGLLFGDFTARFSPVPIPAFDRARALEGAFELSWDQAHDLGRSGWSPDNRLREGLLDYWTEDGAAPALLLNATEAETGRRMVLSPIEKVNSTLRTYAAAAEPRDDGSLPDIRLSTAAMVSARFPFITPAASLRLKRNPEAAEGEGFPKLRLVDGGYYENLGIETAVDLIMAARPRTPPRFTGRRGLFNRKTADDLREQRDEIREALRNFRQDVDLRVIVFDLTEDRFRPAAYSFGEALTPLKALLNTRVSRSELAQQRARDQFRSPCRYIFLGGGAPPGSSGADDDYELNQVCLPSEIAESRIWSVSLNDYEYDFQLGWILSRDTLNRIAEQLGDPNPVGCSPLSSVGPEDAAESLPADGGVDNGVAAQIEAAEKLGFTDGISITEDPSSAPQTEDALARHNACIGSFVLDQLRIGPGDGSSSNALNGGRTPGAPG